MSSHNNSFVQGIVLFFFGFAVLLLGLTVVLRAFSVGTSLAVFTLADFAVLYILIFGPLLLGHRIEELTGGRIVSLGIAWRGVVLYALLTIVVVCVAYSMSDPPLMLLSVVQLMGLFCFALYSYFGQITYEHISRVEEAQAKERASIDRLRDMSRQLSAQVSGLDSGHDVGADGLVSLIVRIEKELRYLVPVQTAEAEGLENELGDCLSLLSARVATKDPALLSAEQTKDLARDALSLIAQRKALYNA